MKKHRESEHQMLNKVYCRYFPNCLDEDECLYVHEKLEESRTSGCVNGSSCRDQSCRFTDKEHIENKTLCKFQRNCNRLNCAYKHNVNRKAFLESGSTKENIK